MANEERGEFELTLGGATYDMRPTFEALQEFEGADGLKVTEMAIAASRGALSVTACAIIVTACIKAWGRETKSTSTRGFQVEPIGKLILAEGVVNVQTVLAEMLLLCSTGGLTTEGKRKAAPTKPKTEAADVSADSAAPRSGGPRKRGGPPRR